MKITKYVHACLLVETENQTILVDPGQFSWESGFFELEDLEKLDTVVITHEHFDHFHQPFIEAVLHKFPEVKIVSTPTVVKKLRELGATHASSESAPEVEVFSVNQHASLEPIGVAPENIAVHVADTLTIGGDRHDLEESRNVLALTVTAPWGSMINAAGMAQRLKPKKIIPVHDWHWNEQAREGAYSTLEGFFANQNIEFIKVRDGQAIEV